MTDILCTNIIESATASSSHSNKRSELREIIILTDSGANLDSSTMTIQKARLTTRFASVLLRMKTKIEATEVQM